MFDLIQVISTFLPIVIITSMQVFSKIRQRKLTAQAPFLFLRDNDRNRLMTTMVFGYFSKNVANLIINPITYVSVCKKVTMPEIYICNFFAKILLATLQGLMAYPLFALITSPHILIASLIGLSYVIWEMYRIGLNFEIFGDTPILIFLVNLLFGFTYRVYMCIKTGVYEMPDKDKSVVLSYQINHVRQLIKKQSLIQHYKPTLVDRVKCIFKAWYKFPPVIFHSLIIILTIIYNVVILHLVALMLYFESISYLIVIWFVLSILLYLFNILHFLFCVQRDTLSVYSGNHHKIFDKKNKQFNLALYHHIAFPAYLVSAMVIGFISCIFIVGIGVSIVYFPLTLISTEELWVLVRLFISFVGVGLVFNFVQRLIIRYCLTDREISKMAINLKHIRMFYVLAFFMFFVNIIRSGISFIKRFLMTVTTLFLFFGRIDRNPLMFFKSMDISATYGSFLRVENVFKNPTMRLFCQILMETDVPHVLNLTTQDSLRNVWGCVIKPKRGNWCNNDTNEWMDVGLGDSRSKDSKRNRNRWHLAYTLLNNPSLVKQRKLQNYIVDNGDVTCLIQA